MTWRFENENDFIIFYVKNDKVIFGTKTACHMTVSKIYSEFENVL